ncbi:PARP8 polymerase, partial [Polypterus senegalus]
MNAEDQNLGEPYECENAEQQEKFPAQQNPSSTQVEAILESENYSAFEIGDDAGGFTKNNTYVSNSENDDDVLVTRDPIPVIFHRITSEIRINSDATSCLSIKTKLQNDRTQDSRLNSAIEEDSEGDNDSEEFYYGGQVNYDGELHKHPQLEADLAAVRELYGSNAVSLSLLSEGALNSVRVCVLLHSLPYVTVIRAVEKGDKKTVDIAEQFGIPTSTLSTFLKEKEKILKLYSEKSCGHQKRMRECEYPVIEQYILKWFVQARDRNVPIDGKLLQALYVFQSSDEIEEIDERDASAHRRQAKLADFFL